MCACVAFSIMACGSKVNSSAANNSESSYLSQEEQQSIGEKIESDYSEAEEKLDSLQDTIDKTMDEVVAKSRLESSTTK